METKQFVTMAVGLVIGVLLISGVVAPVIADVSNNSESGSSSGESFTNVGNEYYIKNTDTTSFTYYPGNNGYYIDDGEDLSDGNVSVLSESWGLIEMFPNRTYFSVRLPEVYGQLHPTSLTMNGHVLSFTDEGETQYTISDVVMCSYPTGDFVDVMSGDGSTRYVFANTPIVSHWSGEWFSWTDRVTISGTLNNSNVYSAEFWEDERIYHMNTVFKAPVTYSVSEDQLVSVTTSYDTSSQYESEYTEAVFGFDDDFEPTDWETYVGTMEKCILPVEVSSGGSGGSVSPTLVAMLSVIPLLLTVGLVIGAIAYMKRA